MKLYFANKERKEIISRQRIGIYSFYQKVISTATGTNYGFN